MTVRVCSKSIALLCTLCERKQVLPVPVRKDDDIEEVLVTKFRLFLKLQSTSYERLVSKDVRLFLALFRALEFVPEDDAVAFGRGFIEFAEGHSKNEGEYLRACNNTQKAVDKMKSLLGRCRLSPVDKIEIDGDGVFIHFSPPLFV